MGKVANDPRRMPRELSAAPPRQRTTTESEHGVAVWEALQLPAFAQTRVVAGHDGLTRRVSRANIMEVPDIGAWVKPQELLLTTGYPLRDVPDGLASLVSDARRRRCLRARGQAASLPRRAARRDAAGGGPARLPGPAARRRRSLRRPAERRPGRCHHPPVDRPRSGPTPSHASLVSVVLDGGGLEELAQALDAQIEGDIARHDHRRPCARGGRRRRRAARPGRPLRRVRAVPVRAVRPGQPPGGRRVRWRWRRCSPARPTTDAWCSSADDGPVPDGDLAVLERAATVFALAVTKSLAVQAVEAKYRGDFLRDVLHRPSRQPRERGRALRIPWVGTSIGRSWSWWRLSTALGRRLRQRERRRRGEADQAAQRIAAGPVRQRVGDGRGAPRPGRAGGGVRVRGRRAGRRVRRRQSSGRPWTGWSTLVRGDGGGGRRSFGAGVSRVDPRPVRHRRRVRAGPPGRARRAAAAGLVVRSRTSTTSARSGCSA